MKKQKSLFESVESKTKIRKKKKKKPTKLVEKENSSEISVSNKDVVVEKEKIIKKIPKQEMYKCTCGLKIHWKIAEARGECPQCNEKIDPKQIFDFASE